MNTSVGMKQVLWTCLARIARFPISGPSIDPRAQILNFVASVTIGTQILPEIKKGLQTLTV
jgi:hypothetical protein